MLNPFYRVFAPAVSIGCPGNSKQGMWPLLRLQMSDVLCTFVKKVRLLQHILLVCLPSFLCLVTYKTLGSEVRAHL